MEKNNSINLDSIPIVDLIAYEKAAKIICSKYENMLKTYDGTINQNALEYQTFRRINGKHLAIIEEIERRIEKLK